MNHFTHCSIRITIWGLSGVVHWWSMGASVGHDPPMSIFCVHVDPCALSRLKVTAGRSRTSSIPHREIIYFYSIVGARHMNGLKYHLKWLDLLEIDFLKKGQSWLQALNNVLLLMLIYIKRCRWGHSDLSHFPVFGEESRATPKDIAKLPTSQHVNRKIAGGLCRQHVPEITCTFISRLEDKLDSCV